MNRLRRCPFCRKEVKDSYPYLAYFEELDKWVLSHYCNKTNAATIDVYGKTEQEVIDKWNGIYEDEESESL